MQLLNIIYFEPKYDFYNKDRQSCNWICTSISLDEIEEYVKVIKKRSLSSSNSKIDLKSYIKDIFDYYLDSIENQIYSPRTILLYGENENYGFIPNLNSNMKIKKINIKEIIENINFTDSEIREIKDRKEKNIEIKDSFKKFLKEFKEKN